jgi:transposase
MTLPSCTIGIDVSQLWLDCFAQPAGKPMRFANSPAGIAALLAVAGPLGGFYVLEATGSYDAALVKALHAAGLAFHRANPRKARQFAQAAGFLAKTDRVDARMLAAYGAGVALRAETAVAPEREELKLLVGRRDQLVDLRKIERTRLAEAAADWLAESFREVIAGLDGQIARIESRIRQLLARTPVLASQKAILCSAPGIGPVTASVLLALLPDPRIKSEEGQRDRRAISALAGLAPLAFESGAMRGQRHIWGGRKRVRDALYMAALAACRSGPFQAIYQAMRASGKPAKLALIAIARQLLVALNAAIRDQKPFTT